ncbi:hypothetical protein F0562_016500 [Nyssa sinensis]|uniref:Glycosyltransferase n=1 Tax=Nyssa sinensis TaxID=561372 RepID=A0A5J4ZM25_9ASTE|nr:hypothetical protein F0562_016500 [Nyssa sinensis]
MEAHPIYFQLIYTVWTKLRAGHIRKNGGQSPQASRYYDTIPSPRISTAHQHSAGDDLFAEARQSGLDIRYMTVSDGFPVEFDPNFNLDRIMETVLHVFPGLMDEIVGKIVGKSDPPVSCLITDTFHKFSSRIAEKYKLVNVSFWTEPALVFTLYYHLDLLRINGHVDSINGNRKDIIDYIPGIRTIEATDLMSHLRETDTSTLLAPVHFQGLLKKPFLQLGPFFLQPSPRALCQQAYGPSQTAPNGSTPSLVDLFCMFPLVAWQMLLKPTVVEIAHGLLLSRVNFVWVLRRDIVSLTESYSLPVGFEDDIKDRGLIVPWCSQIAVISHPSIGGFLTHCGWNSILESIWCTVPLLCFPLYSDQPTNRKLVVDDWRIGINLCDKKSVTREEVAEKINRLISEKSGDELRKEIKKLKRTLENAMATAWIIREEF